MTTLRLLEGDARLRLAELAPASVQTVVTSPPYFNTRAYEDLAPVAWGGDPGCEHWWLPRDRYSAGSSAARRAGDAHSAAGPANAARVRAARWYREYRCNHCGAWLGDLGREETPAEYVAHLVELFRALRPTLTATGTLWLNLGDAHAGAGYSNHRGTGHRLRAAGGRQRHLVGTGYRTKSLLGIPWRVALALMEDGWLLRQYVVWRKPGAQTEPSAKDRPWTETEFVFLFAVAGRYFYAPSPERRWNVWTAPPGRDKAHSAVMSPTIAGWCVEATSAPGDLVLDPFAGAGTTLAAALARGRDAVGIELSSSYAARLRARFEGG